MLPMAVTTSRSPGLRIFQFAHHCAGSPHNRDQLHPKAISLPVDLSQHNINAANRGNHVGDQLAFTHLGKALKVGIRR
jgi:hypothetical protein